MLSVLTGESPLSGTVPGLPGRRLADDPDTEFRQILRISFPRRRFRVQNQTS